jgi:ABC-type transport system involved in cytochrome c biogenesis permease subunit
LTESPSLANLSDMTQNIFYIAAALYWVSFALRVFLWNRDHARMERFTGLMEKAALVVLTGALVLYIGKLQIVDGEVRSEHYNRPVSWLLFTWSINAAHLTTEIVYGNRFTAIFANIWTALALSFAPWLGGAFRSIFNNDLQWLSFHRLCFLLGYSFCVLAFPLALRFLWIQYRGRHLPEDERAALERQLWKFDRLGYRMILWALPLLSAGIITEALLLLEVGQLPGPAEIWSSQRETMLALGTWFICGIYLHARLFFGWRNLKTAALYLGGLIVVVFGHLSQRF